MKKIWKYTSFPDRNRQVDKLKDRQTDRRQRRAGRESEIKTPYIPVCVQFGFTQYNTMIAVSVSTMYIWYKSGCSSLGSWSKKSTKVPAKRQHNHTTFGKSASPPNPETSISQLSINPRQLITSGDIDFRYDVPNYNKLKTTKWGTKIIMNSGSSNNLFIYTIFTTLQYLNSFRCRRMFDWKSLVWFSNFNVC